MEYYTDPVSKHVVALRDAAIEKFNELYDATPELRRVKALAIALCKANGTGHPDTLTMGGPSCPIPTKAGKEAIAILHPIQPAWVTFVYEAEDVIKLMDQIDAGGLTSGY